MRVVAVVGLACLCASACSLFTSLDGVSGGAADVPDGEAPADVVSSPGDSGQPTDDAATEAAVEGGDAGDAGGDAGPNLQPNGDFELFTGGSGCGSEWDVFQGTPTRVTDARSGAYACQACGTNGSDNNYDLNDGDSTGVNVAPGERYVAEAWVRAVSADAGAQTVKGSIRIWGPGATIVQRVDPPAIALTTTWTRIETIIDTTTSGSFNYYIQFNNGPLYSCGLVDDVVIRRVY